MASKYEKVYVSNGNSLVQSYTADAWYSERLLNSVHSNSRHHSAGRIRPQFYRLRARTTKECCISKLRIPSQPECSTVCTLDMGWARYDSRLQHEHYSIREFHHQMFKLAHDGVYCSRQLLHCDNAEYHWQWE